MITVIKTANYSLTFNNDVLASAKCLLTGRFVKRSIALAEHQAAQQVEQAVESLTTYVVKTTVVAASKILFSASIMTTLTILFIVAFAGLFLAFFAASSGNVYMRGFLMTFIVTVVCGGIGLYLLDQFNTVKNQLQKVIA